jgi:hypothetical protein
MSGFSVVEAKALGFYVVFFNGRYQALRAWPGTAVHEHQTIGGIHLNEKYAWFDIRQRMREIMP